VTQAALAAGGDPAEIRMEARVTWSGDPDRIAQELDDWAAAGATHVTINTMGSGLANVDEHLDVLERVAWRT
jgi:alkanesulfonate monooxygenase SsuD/methylene tetrahydromethanopterin reductase-like flavin-dependent oxidoreductase (luciferase family)